MSFTINEAVSEYQQIVEDRTAKKIDDPGVRERVANLNSKCRDAGVIFSADADVIIRGVKGEVADEVEDDSSFFGNDSWDDDWESFEF